MALPNINSNDDSLPLILNRWQTQLNPLVDNAALKCLVLKSIALTTGANVVNHKLGRQLQGWHLVRQRSAGTVYDTQDSNASPSLTLQLTASANMTVDILVF